MSEYMFTMQEKNEYGSYDKLYPKTHASLIVNPPQATGARIDVLCLPASFGITVNLSGQKTASATTDSSGKCSFEGLDYGEYRVSATISGSEKSDTVSVDASKIYDVGLGISKTLNDNSWATISTISKAGLASTFWSVGDCKAITLNGTAGTLALSNYSTYVYILDFNHDKSSSTGTADGITFGTFKSALSGGVDISIRDSRSDNDVSSYSTSYYKMTDSTSYLGWNKSSMRYNVLGSTGSRSSSASSMTATSPVSNTLMSCLPSDLRAVMRPMYIYTDNTGNGSDTASYVTGTLDYLPLLAEFEIQGTRTYANSAEQNYQTQYQYYKDGNSKIKYAYNSSSVAMQFWYRSPRVGVSNYYVTSNTAGGTYYRQYYYSQPIAPMFKV